MFYNGGTAKFETTNTGVLVTGNIDTTGNVDLPNSSGATEGRILLGTNDNLSLYYDGSLNKIETSGADIVIRGTDENLAVFKDNGAVQLFHDNVERLATSGSGVSITGNLVIPSGNGIDFSATADGVGSSQNELLDDYEEGLWVPVLKFGGSDSGITYSSIRVGSYTKFGRQVSVHFGFNLTDKGSQSGSATISGLPFNPVSNIVGTSIEANGIVSWWNQVDPNIINIVLSADDADDELNIRLAAAAVDSPTTMTNSYFQDDTELRGSITYFVAT